jgi:putative transposase
LWIVEPATPAAYLPACADRDYVYVWVDGVHFNIRLEDDRLCTLVMIGARADGTKELIAVEDGYRESAESWKTVLRDLKRRGMHAPVVAVGDGALGFWAAVRDVWPKTRAQRDWSTNSATSSTSSRSGSSHA